ncbi:MAG TPA: sarcosine oxidase subunit delta [Acidimicrobiia bacterium]|nr:sarcosine oxidase subunit delta [Acidimicrobiia bacterium]
MIRLPCPHCGPRNASEFRYLGEDRERPDPADATPQEWRTNLYRRVNPAGWTTETWHHSVGCRAFLTVERHTVTNEIRSCVSGGNPRPPGDAGAHRP